MKVMLVRKRKNLFKSIRYFEKRLDTAMKEMDFEEVCRCSTAIGKRYKEIERLNELIVDVN